MLRRGGGGRPRRRPPPGGGRARRRQGPPPPPPPAGPPPGPPAGAAPLARRFRLDLVAVCLLVLSVLTHAAHRLHPAAHLARLVAWATLALGFLPGALAVAGTLARPPG